MIKRLHRSPDTWAILSLCVLWGLFFWRFYTPNELDAVSLKEGDFSGQFVSWTSYSVERLGEGEIPLWNPYMNAGAPHLADPQTAVLYPPRLLTAFLLSALGHTSAGDVYQALQVEMTLHVLLGLLLMYAFLRRLTSEILPDAVNNPYPTVLASILGALAFAFGGFMSAYPQLQLPLLETAIWLPLVLLGIHEATRPTHTHIGWRCVVLAGVGLALSVLAGHPQTFLLTGYLAVAYLLYRSRHLPITWLERVLAIGLLGAVAAGLSAAQLFLTFDFQRQTYRQALGFDDKGGGFAFQDIAQILFPDLLGRWSPLYIGILGIILVGIAVWRRVTGYGFWLAAALLALLLGFGQKTFIYNLIYVLLPGFSLFRGQERAVFVVSGATAILIALGATAVLTWNPLSEHKAARDLRRVLLGLTVFCAVVALVFFFLRLIPPHGELYETALQSTILAAILALASFILLPLVLKQPQARWYQIALVILLVFDLFSVNMSNANYESQPASERLPIPDYITSIRAQLDDGQRVEGLRGIRQSYASLYRVPDIWGDSPLRLDNMEFFLWHIPIERRWELLSVQMVNSEWDTLPVQATIITTGQDVEGAFKVFKLENPRPFAWLVFETVQVKDRDAARALVADTSFPLREKVILTETVALSSQDSSGQAELTRFESEHIEIKTIANAPAILSLALPYTTGWQAKIDGESVELLEAYGGLTAISVASGSHTISLTYAPASFYYGRFISLGFLIGIVGMLAIPRRRLKEQKNA